MGIIANVKGFLAKKAANAVEAVNDKVSDAARLSDAQLALVEERRRQYLAGMPGSTGEGPAGTGGQTEAGRLTAQKQLGAIGIEVYQDYLNRLKEIYEPYDPIPGSYRADTRIMYFDITKWVTDREEKNLDRLVNVYHVLSEEDCSVALIYHRKKEGCRITMGIANTDADRPDPSVVQGLYKRVTAAVRGNFPGAELHESRDEKDSFGIGVPETLQEIGGEKHLSVAVVTNLPSEKSENFISQSMEKLLDGIVPEEEGEEYSIVLIAKPLRQQLEKQNRLYELYTGLAPYASWQTSFTYTESTSASSGADLGVNGGVGAGAQYAVPGRPVRIAGRTPVPAGNEGSAGAQVGRTLGNQLRRAAGGEPGQNGGGVNVGVNFGLSFARSSNVSVQLGKNESITENYTNFGVKHTLELIESQLKRIEESAALGMWDFAAYVISEDPVTANNAAHMYISLTQGEHSFLTRTSLSLWNAGSEGPERRGAETILRSVGVLQHPFFKMKEGLADDWLLYPSLIVPTTLLSGTELAKALNFPRRSVAGFPVLESVSFGRDVQRFEGEAVPRGAGSEKNPGGKLCIGSICHMRKKEAGSPVQLDVDSLASHTFVTGTTGTGKSNMVYQMLDQLRAQGKKFLVIEPTKGQYKEVFGGYEDVAVYGTNAKRTPLLGLNPFSFPDSVHVLEHIDRLVEILNACWPMYAAMPAVLKDAIEQTYLKKGWDLAGSTCRKKEFPDFKDLLEELPKVLSGSGFSEETRNDYAGALMTRVKSLTNGLNREILCAGRELSAQELFERNVIIDLSRVGSTETKALFMGILIMKLQEYRLEQDEMDAPLRHVTVLEEAHRLLRRTSFAQHQESANLQGKSVEMLSEAIAEMRSYGEGFLIADQAPELLDESVIRNTNTKIVFRLPEEADRRTAGAAMALSGEQIGELAKLPKGVAAVYQNDWLQAVLCASERFDDRKKKRLMSGERECAPACGKFLDRIFGGANQRLDGSELERIDKWIDGRHIGQESRRLIREAMNRRLTEEEKAVLAYNLFRGKRMMEILSENGDDPEEGKRRAVEQIALACHASENSTAEQIYRLILAEMEARMPEDELIRAYTRLERGHLI